MAIKIKLKKKGDHEDVRKFTRYVCFPGPASLKILYFRKNNFWYVRSFCSKFQISIKLFSACDQTHKQTMSTYLIEYMKHNKLLSFSMTWQNSKDTNRREEVVWQ